MGKIKLDNKSKIVNVRVTGALWYEIAMMCEIKNVSPSELIRKAIAIYLSSMHNNDGSII